MSKLVTYRGRKDGEVSHSLEVEGKLLPLDEATEVSDKVAKHLEGQRDEYEFEIREGEGN